MRLPRPRRLILVLALLLWVGAVWWYWRWHLPLVPVETLRIEEGWQQIGGSMGHELEATECRTLLANGFLVLARRVLIQDETGELLGHESRGPLRVWDPLTHRVVHEIDVFDDPIREGWVLKQGVAILSSDREIVIVNLREGRVVLRKPVAGQYSYLALSPDARLVKFRDTESKSEAIYETETGHIAFAAKASRDEISFRGFHSAVIWDAMAQSSHAVSTETWQEVPVPEASSTGVRHRYSTDARRVIAEDEGSTILVDCVDDRIIASFPRTVELFESQWDFCRDNSELIEIALPGREIQFYSGPPPGMDYIGESRLRLTRRASADGRRLSEATVDSIGVVPASHVSPDGRVFIGYHEAPQFKLPNLVRQGLAKAGFDWEPALQMNYVAVDAVTGKLIANVAPTDVGLMSIFWDFPSDFCETLFTVITERQILTFAYPLQRRWGWLLTWSLGPPAGLWLLTAAWRRWRRRARVGGASSMPRVPMTDQPTKRRRWRRWVVAM